MVVGLFWLTWSIHYKEIPPEGRTVIPINNDPTDA
jgi:hypothetical protein